MILVRVVFQSKHGRASELVAGMKEALKNLEKVTGAGAKGRLLTDLTGPMDTVVLETVHPSLAAWEQARAFMFTTPEYQSGQTSAEDVVMSGHQEYYTIEAES